MLMTLHDCVVWARLVVRTCEDLGLDGEVVHREAVSALADIKTLATNPTQGACDWTRCTCPRLLDYAEQASRMGRMSRVRAYEAIIAVRMLATETGELCLAAKGAA
jgi:hypothetical protein